MAERKPTKTTESWADRTTTDHLEAQDAIETLIVIDHQMGIAEKQWEKLRME